jgi:hypothetical protein
MELHKNHVLVGEEKNTYLQQLDLSLGVLSKHLANETGERHKGYIHAFGDEKDWNWNRLPSRLSSYEVLADLVDRVKDFYGWFDWKTSEENPLDNMGNYTEVELSPSSGLPWLFNLINLHHLKRDIEKHLGSLPTYEENLQVLRDTLGQDGTNDEEARQKVEAIKIDSMRRNFFERLDDSELIGWQSGPSEVSFRARKILPYMGEDLWNISFIDFVPHANIFQVYSIDLWQDNRRNGNIQAAVEEENGSVKVSNNFIRSLDYSPTNAAWFILKSIDESYDNLHPVHVSRALIGPFETKYLTNPGDIKPLPITGELLEDEPDVGLLRFSRQYSYAPNHVEHNKLRQIIYREKWAEEFIVCPATHSARVANSVKGTDVTVVEI